MRDVIFVEGISEYQFQRKIWKGGSLNESLQSSLIKIVLSSFSWQKFTDHMMSSGDCTCDKVGSLYKSAFAVYTEQQKFSL